MSERTYRDFVYGAKEATKMGWYRSRFGGSLAVIVFCGLVVLVLAACGSDHAAVPESGDADSGVSEDGEVSGGQGKGDSLGDRTDVGIVDDADNDVTIVDESRGRAMWAWRTSLYRENPSLWDELLAFCGEQGIDEVFLQIETVREGDSGSRSIREPEVLRDLLRRAHVAGVSVHALDGDSSFALRTEHALVLALVDAVLSFNARSAPEERFVGIRMDVEPYSLAIWTEDRPSIMLQWLEMNALVVEHLVNHGSSMTYGIDIPFWLDSTESGGALTFGIEYKGVYQDLSRHFIDMVDNIGIMAYREVATGPNGIIALSEDELRYASESGGARVYIGVETMDPDPPGIPASITFGDRNLDFMEAALDEVVEVARGYSAFKGIAIHHYESYRLMQ